MNKPDYADEPEWGEEKEEKCNNIDTNIYTTVGSVLNSA